jgi:hypothetical protein
MYRRKNEMGKHESKEVIFYLNGEEIAKAHTIPADTIIGTPVGTITERIDASRENKVAEPKSSKDFPREQEEN